MKVLKYVGIGLGSLIALFLLIAVFLPGKYHVERSQTFAAPPDSVYAQIVNFSKWDKWDPWSEMDPGVKHTYTGTDGQLGSTRAWEGEQTGKGAMTLKAADPGKRIDIHMDFMEPMAGTAEVVYTFAPTADGGTTVVWGIDGDNAYPIGRFFGLMMDGMLGPTFEKGLANLQGITDANPTQPAAETATAADSAAKK